ncbi:type VI secretion system baseplate subunit TssG [Ciceribacter sp. L1K22]|uniref:type VI secretion system baseplate subunit TssG n=1 Tax=Ciceribacter sp. L1K22 TaxID=2820275 RepID=UPI001ABDAC9A|nr:type VI secretion system baseplate subunit TssG [Ciceribacter sp. L1K22]MBO3761683.1 type VI secretion system baseplate subunit TssG [Ciceribacter sp. L1K22]
MNEPVTILDETEVGVEPIAAANIDGLREFRFHQLVALMELRRRDARPIGELGDPTAEYLRFRATRSLSFGPADISEVDYDEKTDRLDVRVNFFGLYGPASPLPPAYTESIIEADATLDPVEDFLDLFNHRLISLLHVIWRKNRYYLRYRPGGSDPLSRRFLALCGFPIEDRDQVGVISRSALLPHLGLISLFSNSSEVVGATLSNFFNIPCQIEEFVPRKVNVGRESRLTLGMANNLLGGDAILGYELDDDLGKFRIHLGPADFDRLSAFLPNGSRHRQFCELLLMATREPLEWDLKFAFAPDTLPTAQLGSSQLGWTTWLQADEPGALESDVLVFVNDRLYSVAETEGGRA